MSARVPVAPLDAADTVELVELLGFVNDWLLGDFHRLRVSFDRVAGHGYYDLDELCDDLARFAFLLGGPGDHYLNEDQQ